MSKTLYVDLILDLLKSKSLLATDSSGKIIEASISASRLENDILMETGDSLLTEASYYITL